MRLELTPLQSRQWEVVNDFTIQTDFGTFIVPRGFVTDLASSPQFMWWLIPPTGEYVEAAVLHDFLYRTKLVKKKVADVIFHKVMLQYNTKKWKAKLMYNAVKYFGHSSYDNSEQPLHLISDSSMQKLKKDLEEYNNGN